MTDTVQRFLASPIVFLDCEFTDLLRPELLSLGLVSARGDEHYVELDPSDQGSAPTLARASEFVRDNGVLEQWGRVPGATASFQEMGVRTARWLLTQAQLAAQPLRIAFDYAPVFRLLESLLRQAGQWQLVSVAVLPFDVGEKMSMFEVHLAAEAAYEWTGKRGLDRHHALADAHALRVGCAAYFTGKRLKL